MTIKILSQNEVARRIDRIVRITGRVQNEVHILAVSCLDHIREHGDTRGALRLLDNLPRSIRKEGLAVWFQHFSSGKVKFHRDAKSGVYTAKLNPREDADFKIAEAAGTPFWDLTEEKRPGKTLTVSDLLTLLKQKATNDKTNDDGSPKVAQSARELAADLLAYVESKATA